MFSVKECAKILNYGTETVLRRIRNGELIAVKKTDRDGYRVSEDNLNLFMEKMEQGLFDKKRRSVKNNLNMDSHQGVILASSYNKDYIKECLNVIWQGVLRYPLKHEVLELLSEQDMKRAIELIFVVRNYTKPIGNMKAFIESAIKENWTIETEPVPKESKPNTKKYESKRKEITPSWLNKSEQPTEQVAALPEDLEEVRQRLKEELKVYRKTNI